MSISARKIFLQKTQKNLKIPIDKSIIICYTNQAVAENARKHGGIAQLARAIGSYPIGRGFKSNFRYHQWPVGQAVKTPPFHGGNRSSILLRVTKKDNIRTV